jgi:hypothetical protein
MTTVGKKQNRPGPHPIIAQKMGCTHIPRAEAESRHGFDPEEAKPEDREG